MKSIHRTSYQCPHCGTLVTDPGNGLVLDEPCNACGTWIHIPVEAVSTGTKKRPSNRNVKRRASSLGGLLPAGVMVKAGRKKRKPAAQREMVSARPRVTLPMGDEEKAEDDSLITAALGRSLGFGSQPSRAGAFSFNVRTSKPGRITVGPRGKGRRGVFPVFSIAVMALVVGVCLAILFWPGKPETRKSYGPSEKEISLYLEMERAKELVALFFNVRTCEERAGLVLQPESNSGRLRDFYRTHDIFAEEVDEIVERETVKKGADASWEFDVFFKNGERRTVTAVGTPAGYRIDWARYEIAAGGGLSDESASSLADAGDSAG